MNLLSNILNPNDYHLVPTLVSNIVPNYPNTDIGWNDELGWFILSNEELVWSENDE